MKAITPLVKGIITGMLMVLCALLFYYTNVQAGSVVHYTIYLVFFLGILWTLITHTKTAAYTGSFGNLFNQGFRCFIITILIMVAFTSIFNLMHPEFAENAAEAYRADLIKEGGKLPKEIDELVSKAKKQYNTGVVYFTIFGYLVIGAIFTALASVIIKVITPRK